jgi:hypothetical protein
MNFPCPMLCGGSFRPRRREKQSQSASDLGGGPERTVGSGVAVAVWGQLQPRNSSAD